MTEKRHDADSRPLPLNVDNSLLFKMVRMTNHMSHNYEHSPAREHGLSVKDWRMVLVIASHPGTSAAAMSKFSGYDQMSVGRTIRKLVRLNWVYLTVNPQDQRETFVYLTEKGRGSYGELARRIDKYERDILSVLSVAQHRTLEKLLTKLTEKVTGYHDE
ncbi:MAG: MarR family transcriptional regulator [Alphaproteobacteria bacterium]|nr:MarR family transcriptional regulator [Alphaproteobacteria bacterium]